MRVGDLVELRSPSEILATLDETGSLDGLPFMPEMLGFFGKQIRVTARTERVCDTVQPVGLRKIPDAVLLDDFRCDGSGHLGCQAQCRIYWKEAWLRPVVADRPPEPAAAGSAYEELEQLAKANVGGESSTAGVPIYRCQATELRRESEPVEWWDPKSFLGQVTGGEVGMVRFVRVMTRVVLSEIGQRLGFISRFPFMPQNPPGYEFVSPPPLDLQVGEMVRVRSKEEIAKTLTPASKTKGLWFDREMLPYCGRTVRVQTKVKRFINEKNGQLVELNSDCYILEGVVCMSEQSDGRWFCPRAIYSWWRECWLERVNEVPQDGRQAPRAGLS